MANLPIEGEYDAEHEQMLCRCQLDNAGSGFCAAEETTTTPTRIVKAVLQPQEGAGLAIGDAVLDRSRNCFDGLWKPGPATVAVPCNLRPDRYAPVLIDCPMHRQLRGHPIGARASGSSDFFRPELILERNHPGIALPLRDAVRKEAPEFERGVGLMRTGENGFLQSPMGRRFVGQLAAGAGNIVGVGQVPIPVDNEDRPGELVAKGIAGVHSEHQIRRVVCSPGSRVRKVILRVKRVIADQTSEDSCLYGEPLPNRGKIRDIRWSEMTKEIRACQVWRCRRESE